MAGILNRINSAADLKELGKSELYQLSTEIRELLINRVTENGGHLASNLGVVELAVALHRVFDSPKDKIVWDVGHQSYVHKLLTGRKDQFFTLRKYQGISGFPDRDESTHDVFTTGHGGTSISAALGMALSNELTHDDSHVIAVIGDGCLTAGMAYEALNHAGHLGTRLIVVLNDNGMSISPTVGALAKRLSMLRTGYQYKTAKGRIDRLLSLLPRNKRLLWAIYSTFLQRGFDQLLHDVCLPDLPVTFALDRSGIVGEDGKTHQGIFDLSYLGLMPNMIISVPRNENELQHLLYTALEAGHPMAIRYPRSQGDGIPLDPDFHKLPIGKGEIIRKGKDIAIIAIGSTVGASLEATELLAANGIEASLINARFAKPLDSELILDTANITKRIITVEENVLSGGFGSAVLELLQKYGTSDVKVMRLGIPDVFVPHGKQDLLRSIYHLDAHSIAQECSDFLAHIQPEMQDQFSSAILQH